MKATERETRILSDLIIGLMLEIVELKAELAEIGPERVLPLWRQASLADKGGEKT